MVDEFQEVVVHLERRDEQLFDAFEFGEAGEGVEELRDFLAQIGVGGEETKVGVKAGGAGVIISSAKMEIMAQAVFIAADDHEHFAVGFEADQSVDDVDAGFFELAGPDDVVGFVEARAQFDEDGDLLALFGGGDEGVDDGGIAAGAIEGHLDGEHGRVGGGVFQELDHAGEALVGVVEEDVAGADDSKIIAAGRQDMGDDGDVGLVAQGCEGIDRGQRREVKEIERAVGDINVLFFQLENIEQSALHVGRAAMLDFEADGVAARTFAQFVLNGAQEIFRFLLVDIEIAVAGDAEAIDLLDFEARKEIVDVILDQGLDEDVVPLVGLGVGDAHQPRQDARNGDDGVEDVSGAVGPLQFQEEIVALVLELREGVAGVDGQGREDREDFVAEILGGPGFVDAVEAFEIVKVNFYACRGREGVRRSRAGIGR